jgi:hypothetical protein
MKQTTETQRHREAILIFRLKAEATGNTPVASGFSRKINKVSLCLCVSVVRESRCVES